MLWGRVPGIDDVYAAVREVIHVAGSDGRTTRTGYRCDLSVELADGPAQGTACLTDGGILNGGRVIEWQDTSLKIDFENGVG